MKGPAAILVSAVLLLLAACSQPVKVEYRGQVVTVSRDMPDEGISDTLRFGTLHSGEIAVKRISLHNDTDEPIVILSYETTCSCASFDYDRRPVMPGEYGTIECTFDSRGTTGWQMKPVKFYISGTAAPVRILIEADVE